MNHKNRTILLLSYSCDDSSKCDFNFSRHTLVDKRVFWICCICWINKDTHLLCYIQCLLAFECHSCVCGTEQFLSVWIHKNLNLGNTKLLFEEPNTDGRQIISHVLNWRMWRIVTRHQNYEFKTRLQLTINPQNLVTDLLEVDRGTASDQNKEGVGV